ncbi:MAG: hypothetical protein ACF8PG_10735, partial [Maioricimonas sp. JB045]
GVDMVAGNLTILKNLYNINAGSGHGVTGLQGTRHGEANPFGRERRWIRVLRSGQAADNVV